MKKSTKNQVATPATKKTVKATKKTVKATNLENMSQAELLALVATLITDKTESKVKATKKVAKPEFIPAEADSKLVKTLLTATKSLRYDHVIGLMRILRGFEAVTEKDLTALKDKYLATKIEVDEVAWNFLRSSKVPEQISSIAKSDKAKLFLISYELIPATDKSKATCHAVYSLEAGKSKTVYSYHGRKLGFSFAN